MYHPVISNTTAISHCEAPASDDEDDAPPPLPPRNLDVPLSPLRKPKFFKTASLSFTNSSKSIDYVLVYDRHHVAKPSDAEKRKIFQRNLLKEGLELEEDKSDEEIKLQFIKIHAPKDVCRRYSEILRLRMPMKKIARFQYQQSTTSTIVQQLSSKWRTFVSKLFDFDHSLFPITKHYFTAIYSRDKEYLFDEDSPNFFTPTVHSRIVQFILDRTLFSLNDSDPCNFGIEHLINDGVYSAAYPLHEGFHDLIGCTRYNLLRGWASLRNLFRRQPLDHIQQYFGVKIALYFTWLGFYTCMLIPASVIGLLCFLFSWNTLSNCVSCKEVCNQTKKIKMCPRCDYNCPYWDIQDSCVHTRITYLFDNWTTVFFTMFMCFWSAMFLEMWKRYSAEITHRWDLTEFDKHEEYPRPEYLARLKHVSKKTVNLITNDLEPKAPFWTMRLPMTLFSFSVIILLVFIVFAAVTGVVLYRLSILAAIYACGNQMMTNYALILTNITAASINLFFILILNLVYSWLARYLTELELHRTQTEFDDSLTLKMYLFQFVNYYASIIYIAFFKGRFIGYPKSYLRIFPYRQEECGLGGCLLEVCIQLAIIMIGKQTMNALMEIIEPIVLGWWNSRKMISRRRSSRQDGHIFEDTKTRKQWVEDYKLVSFGPQALFPEYLEMVMQYGFVTIFVSAFPLAPLFALLNNILEMRLDARKMLTFYRRPVSQRVKNIGIWYRILDSISKLSIFTNGFIIAFTSDFIPKIVYVLTESIDHSLSGYLEFSLSYMNVSEIDLPEKPPNPENITFCRYKDFRNPPWTTTRYAFSDMYWSVLVGRLLFMLVFQNFVALVIILIRWCIPDIPVKLREKIQREKFITNEIIIAQERSRAVDMKEQGVTSRNLEVDTPLSSYIDIESRFKRRATIKIVIHYKFSYNELQKKSKNNLK